MTRDPADDIPADDLEISYLARVEALVIEMTRNRLNLSARDVHRVRRWQASGVPIELIARGLRRALDQWTEPRPPRSLHFAAAEIDTLMARHRQAHPGTGTHTAESLRTDDAPRGDDDPNWPRLEALLVALGRRAAPRSSVRAALRDGYATLQGLRAEAPRPSAHEAWGRIRRRVLDPLRATLSTYDRAQLERELAARPLSAMSAEAAAAHRAHWIERWVAARHDLEALLQWPPPPAPRQDDDDETP